MTAPSAAVLAGALALAGPDASVAELRRLPGGTHASTHLLRTADPSRELVLRDFPDDAADRESRVLTALSALAGLGGFVPRVLATAPGWTVLSRLPGAAHCVPADPADWARRLGVALARIHRTDPLPLRDFPSVFDRRGGSRELLDGPAAEAVSSGWERLRAAPRVLTHYDYWSGNVLWRGAELTGVVDWSGAALGPAGFDVGWARIDMYLLHDAATADALLTGYEAVAGPLPDMRLHDLWTAARSHREVEEWLPNYVELGRPDLTATALRRRHTEWTHSLL